MVLGGAGVSLLPELSVSTEARFPGLCVRSFAEPRAVPDYRLGVAQALDARAGIAPSGGDRAAGLSGHTPGQGSSTAEDVASLTIGVPPTCIIMAEARVPSNFKEPNAIDRIINRAFGFLLKLGIGLAHNYLLEVRGRKTGRTYATPVNVLEHEGRRYLVAPRGYTQWVRNAEASGEATLVRGATRERVKLRAVPDEAKAELLKIYLDRFKPTVQRYFPIPAGSPAKAFDPVAVRYPVFELNRCE